MSQATIAPPEIKTLADLRHRLGGSSRADLVPPRAGYRHRKGCHLEAEPREPTSASWVDGTLVEKAIGFEESRIAGELLFLVKFYLRQNDLGICVGADGMMRIAPGLVRIPDVSFLSWDSLPGRESPREPIPDLAPDLAVEVLREGNTKQEMTRKVREYFDAGVILVWLIDPRMRTARLFSTVEKSTLVRADQELSGGEVLPGFVLRLSDLLDRGRRPLRVDCKGSRWRAPARFSTIRDKIRPGRTVTIGRIGSKQAFRAGIQPHEPGVDQIRCPAD